MGQRLLKMKTARTHAHFFLACSLKCVCVSESMEYVGKVGLGMCVRARVCACVFL